MLLLTQFFVAIICLIEINKQQKLQVINFASANDMEMIYTRSINHRLNIYLKKPDSNLVSIHLHNPILSRTSTTYDSNLNYIKNIASIEKHYTDVIYNLNHLSQINMIKIQLNFTVIELEIM